MANPQPKFADFPANSSTTYPIGTSIGPESRRLSTDRETTANHGPSVGFVPFSAFAHSQPALISSSPESSVIAPIRPPDWSLANPWHGR